METIMRETSDTSKFSTLDGYSEGRDTLRDRELAAVTGGAPSTMVGAFGYMVHIPMGIPSPPSTKPAK
jgi:hypothetical protein